MIKRNFSSELEKGTLILFITMNLFNLLNFLFHFTMGRILGPEDYGILVVLMSITSLYAIPSEAIQTLIAKYTSEFNTKKEYGKIKFLLEKSMSKGIKISVILFILLTLFSTFVSKILQINFWLIFLANFTIFLSFVTPIIRGVMQGRKHFSQLGYNLIIESTLKLIFSVSFVWFNLEVFGAVLGLLISFFAGFIFAMYSNLDILRKKPEKTIFKDIYPKSAPYFISMFAIFLILSVDIVLAKIFFDPKTAGMYAVLSMLGKIIFYGTVAISKAMFPITSERYEKKQDSSSSFKKSLMIIGLLCFAGVIFYAIIPKMIILIFYGKAYLEMAPFLVYSGIALSFLSLSNLMIVYGLSINRMKKSSWLFLFVVFEIIILSLFHASILEYILALMFSNIIMFIGVFLLIRKNEINNKKDMHNNSGI